MVELKSRHGRLHLYGREDQVINIRTVDDVLYAVGCGSMLKMDAGNGRILDWDSDDAKSPVVKQAILAHIYHMWPELTHGEYQPLRLTPKDTYTKQQAIAVALTLLVFTWGGAAGLALLFPVETFTWSWVSLAQIFLLLLGLPMLVASVIDYKLYQESYRLKAQKRASAPVVEGQTKVEVYAELQNVWHSVRPITMDDGNIYRVFDKEKVRELNRIASLLNIKLDSIDESGWAWEGVNQDVAREHRIWLQQKYRSEFSELDSKQLIAMSGHNMWQGAPA